MLNKTSKLILGFAVFFAVGFAALPLEARCFFNFGLGVNFIAPRPCRVYEPVVYRPVPQVVYAPERIVVVRDRYYAPRPCYQRVEVYEYPCYYPY